MAQDKPKDPQTLPELQRAIENVLQETETPAAGVALVQGDSTVWVAGLGLSNLENRVKATENTMFRIGSVSKMFVSLAILKLQEEGRVSLKDKVRDRVPEIEFTNPWEKTTPILVEHLLEHTTGWDDIHLTEIALNDPKLTLKAGLDYHPHSRISRWMPGTRMSYANSGPSVAAYIVEKITGQRFEDYVQEHFFEPMGMENMTYFASEPYKRLGATLYQDKKPQPYWNVLMRPTGAINASPRDVARMLAFFMKRGRAGGRQIVQESSLKRMETPSTSTGARAGLEYGYGLSNYSSPYKRFVYRSHGGGVVGGLTDFSYLPEHQVGYAVMINAGNGHALWRITELIRGYQTRFFPVDSIRLKKGISIREDAISGYYVPINPRIERSYYLTRILYVTHLWAVDRFLFSRGLLGGKTETRVAVSDQQFASKETGKISLVQVNDPLAGEVVHADTVVLKRISPLLAFGQLLVGAAWILYLIGSLIAGAIVIVFYWRGRISNRNTLTLMVWPVLASLCIGMAYLLSFIGEREIFERLAKVSFVSVSIMLLTIGFAVASVGSIISVARQRRAVVPTALYWHTVVLSVLHVVVAGYLLAYGIIGIQIWN